MRKLNRLIEEPKLSLWAICEFKVRLLSKDALLFNFLRDFELVLLLDNVTPGVVDDGEEDDEVEKENILPPCVSFRDTIFLSMVRNLALLEEFPLKLDL